MSKNEKKCAIIGRYREGIFIKGSESRHSQKVHHIRHIVSTSSTRAPVDAGADPVQGVSPGW